MRTPTFTRADIDAARRAWDDGDFSPEWRDVRHRAAMGGLIWPPNGTKHDSWEDDSPSQRAMLIRAIRETPRLLDRCIVGARAWGEVIDRLLAVRDEWRAEVRAEDRRHDDELDPDEREAVSVLGSIIGRIRDSVG